MQHLHKISVMSVLLIAMELNLTLLVQSKAIVRWMKRTYGDAKTIIKIRGNTIILRNTMAQTLCSNRIESILDY